MGYRLSTSAERDLDKIFVYWAERVSSEVADRLIDSVIDHFRLIGEYPNAGKAVGEIARGVRCFPGGKYLIYYRQAGRRTEILRVLHGALERRRAFNKKPTKPSKE